MCLSNVHSNRKWVQEFRKKIKNVKWIKVYKCASYDRYAGCTFTGLLRYTRYTCGVHKNYYGPGFHVFLTRKGAENYRGYNETVVECIVKPEWLCQLGTDCGERAATFKTIVLPPLRARKMTVKKFKEYCKKAGV